MNILASKCADSHKNFSKELFTEVAQNIKLIPEEEWEANRDTHKKVLFAAYVRTNVDNLVLMVEKDKFAKLFEAPPFITECGVYPNLPIDAGMLCGKSLIDFCFSFKSVEALERFVANSTCYPVGAVETSKKYILVFNVVMSADLMRDQEITLKEGFHFYPIETLNLTDTLQRELSSSLVLVSGGVK